MDKRTVITGTIIAACCLAACATGTGPDDEAARTYPVVSQRVLDRFAPTPANDRSVDYELIDEALDLMVFNAGPSLRRRERRPEPMVGSRLAPGHDSPFRLEGNKVFFSQFDDDVKASVAEYRQSLEGIAASGAITRLPRNEQLAFWYNLHNLVVIDEIARAYPVRAPRELRPGGGDARFHDADIIDLGDTSISLRDVRQIVYTHWRDPKVIYGFYWGDLAGPSIRAEAYAGGDVSADLDRQAGEFVNSLRGVRDGGGETWVSPIYEETRPFFFASWPADLKVHLLAYANEDVAPIVADARPVRYDQYQERVADMAGGDVGSDLNAGFSFAVPDTIGDLDQTVPDRNSLMPMSMTRLVSEYQEKIEELRQRGYLRPTITIIDVETDDPGGEEVR